jgi:hypothetical protein
VRETDGNQDGDSLVLPPNAYIQSIDALMYTVDSLKTTQDVCLGCCNCRGEILSLGVLKVGISVQPSEATWYRKGKPDEDPLQGNIHGD